MEGERERGSGKEGRKEGVRGEEREERRGGRDRNW